MPALDGPGDVHLYLTVGGTVVRRGERPLRRHLGEITMPSRRRGCLRTDFVELQIISAMVKLVLVFCKLYHGADLTIFC